MTSTFVVASRRIWTSTSAWSRSRWTMSVGRDLNDSPLRTDERNRSTDRNGLRRALITSRSSALTNSVATSVASNAKS